MEKAHWLGRKRASLKMAQQAESAQARLIHYDLAGRYSLKATSADTAATDLANSVPSSISPSSDLATAERKRMKANPGQVTKISRAQMDESRGSPRDADDAIDGMIRQNVKLHGA